MSFYRKASWCYLRCHLGTIAITVKCCRGMIKVSTQPITLSFFLFDEENLSACTFNTQFACAIYNVTVVLSRSPQLIAIIYNISKRSQNIMNCINIGNVVLFYGGNLTNSRSKLVVPIAYIIGVLKISGNEFFC